MDKYQDIIVNRIGDNISSFMITRKILKEINPRFIYQINKYNLDKTNYLSCNKSNKVSTVIIPKYCEVKGIWNQDLSFSNLDENILGNCCQFTSLFPKYNIPIEVATKEKLAYYNCQFKKIGDNLGINCDVNLPLTVVSIGKKYFNHYIMKKQHGNGFYLEYHDRPHYHQPLNYKASGFIILGKRINQELYHLTGFRIPYGYGIYMPKGVLHNDCCLTGDYLVIYSKTKNFSTANFYYKNNLVKFTFQ